MVYTIYLCHTVECVDFMDVTMGDIHSLTKQFIFVDIQDIQMSLLEVTGCWYGGSPRFPLISRPQEKQPIGA